MSAWETVIGLEVHVQLATASKIFSGSSTTFGASPNSQASAVDLAMPGMLPVLNEKAVRYAVMFGLGIGADVSTELNYIPEKVAHLATSMMSMGAVVIDDNGIYEVTGGQKTADHNEQRSRTNNNPTKSECSSQCRLIQRARISDDHIVLFNDRFAKQQRNTGRNECHR